MSTYIASIASALALAFCTGYLVAQPAEDAQPVEGDHPDVTICHTQKQTSCLWVDGHAEWR